MFSPVIIADLLGVPSEGGNIRLDPLKGEKLVLETKVQCTTRGCFRSLRESKGTKPIVEADVYDRRALE